MKVICGLKERGSSVEKCICDAGHRTHKEEKTVEGQRLVQEKHIQIPQMGCQSLYN